MLCRRAVGVDIDVVEIVFLQRPCDGLLVGVDETRVPDVDLDSQFVVLEGCVDRVGEEVGRGVVVSFVAQLLDDAFALGVHQVLVVVVTLFEQRLVFPLPEELVDIGCLGAERYAVDAVAL